MRAPAQKNSVSRLTIGATDAVTAGFGLNFRIRNIISATASSPTRHVLRVVTNQPSPSAVYFGPTTSSSRLVTASRSPGWRWRW